MCLVGTPAAGSTKNGHPPDPEPETEELNLRPDDVDTPTEGKHRKSIIFSSLFVPLLPIIEYLFYGSFVPCGDVLSVEFNS